MKTSTPVMLTFGLADKRTPSLHHSLQPGVRGESNYFKTQSAFKNVSGISVVKHMQLYHCTLRDSHNEETFFQHSPGV